jgi:L-arabinose transport system permease protein
MAITTAAQTTAKKETSRSGLQLARIWDQYGMLVIFAILFLLASMLIPNFASMINMKGLGLAVDVGHGRLWHAVLSGSWRI